MKNLFKKFIDFETDENRYMLDKLEECNSLEEAFKLFEEQKWGLSPRLVSLIKAEHAKSDDQLAKEAIEAKKAKEADEAKRRKIVAEATKALEQAESAKGAKPSESLKDDPRFKDA